MSDFVPPSDERSRRDSHKAKPHIPLSGSEPEFRPPRARKSDYGVRTAARNIDDGGKVRSDVPGKQHSHSDYRSTKSRRELSTSGSRSDIPKRRNDVDRSASPRPARRSPYRHEKSASPPSGRPRRRDRSMSSTRSRSPPPKRRHRSPSDSPSPPRRRRRYNDEDEDERTKKPPRTGREESDMSQSPPTRRPGRDASWASPPRRTRESDASPSPAARPSYDPVRPSYDRSVTPPRYSRDRGRSRSPIRRDRSPEPNKRRRDSRSPIRRASNQASRSHSPVRRRGPLRDQVAIFRQEIDKRQGRPNRPDDEPIEKEKPNYNTTGLLAKEANTVEGTKVSLKYHEPEGARKPPSSKKWRLYVFKDGEVVQTVLLYQRSCWLIGREAVVADIRVDHPSTSGQHAAIQFRTVKKKAKEEFGETIIKNVVRPYLIDLDSSNGTFLNKARLEPARYVEIRDKDMMKIGGSDREYVFMLPPKE